MSRTTYQCGLERCPGTRGVPHPQAECPGLAVVKKWRATDDPNDACCWSAHVEVDEPKNILRNRPFAIADVCDRETADDIVREHNAHEALVSACARALERLALQDDGLVAELRAALALVGGGR